MPKTPSPPPPLSAPELPADADATAAPAAVGAVGSDRRRMSATTMTTTTPSPRTASPRTATALSLAMPTSSKPRMPAEKTTLRARLGLATVARRTIGISLLLLTVLLWTTTNFLASFIFSDNTYDKPFFLVYINSSVFAVSLVPLFIKYLLETGVHGVCNHVTRLWREYRQSRTSAKPRTARYGVGDSGSSGGGGDDGETAAGECLLVGDEEEALANPSRLSDKDDADDRLAFRETAELSLEFSMLWFAANYFASACLEYTSVASVTILTSTSSMWTLVFCSVYRVETFSVRKLMGVMASLVGVGLISSVDLSGGNDEHRGSFPHKTPGQVAIGDAMAMLSAVIYGLYVTVMKRRVGDEDRVDMRLFFGLVGVFNLVLLWPLFFVLHWTRIEPFEMPPTHKVWTIIAANSLSSFVSDMSWAYAMLLTTPLVVTVGLSLTIPLSLIGEMIQYGQYSSFLYWIGAAVVFVSFLFINNESREDEEGESHNEAGGFGLLAGSPQSPPASAPSQRQQENAH